MQKNPLTCELCGGTCLCFHQEIGGVGDFQDVFTRWCAKCGTVESISKDGGEVAINETATYCPYCGTSCLEHRGIQEMGATHGMTHPQKDERKRNVKRAQ